MKFEVKKGTKFIFSLIVVLSTVTISYIAAVDRSNYLNLQDKTSLISPSPQVLGWTINCNWIGATGGAWETAGNWNCDGTNRVPTSGDRATIDANVTVNINATTTVDDLVLGDTAGTYSPILNFNYNAISSGALIIDESNLYVYQGASITHTEGTTAVVGTVNIDVQAGNATIDGIINVKAKGYAASEGIGQGTDGNGAGGAGHGGQGGNDAYANTPGGIIYGSMMTPTSLGSGGGKDGTVGAKGGGAVKITVAETTTLAGSINAEGQTNPGTLSVDAGGGSGGSVYITTATLVGSGTITVNGSNGYRYGGAGAGGRVAIYYTTDSSTVTITSYGGLIGGSGGNIAAAGTIYKEQLGGDKIAIIDNSNRDAGVKYTNLPDGLSITSLTVSNLAYLYANNTFTATTINLTNNGIIEVTASGNVTYTTFNWASGGLFRDRGGTFALISGGGALVVPTGAILYADTARTYTGVTISGTISNTANTTAETYLLRHTITGGGTYTINSGGSINIDGKGYGQGSGPCKGTNGNGAGGGGHGGEGGDSNAVQGGGICGSLTQPINLGSGGGIDVIGGAGGGSVKLDITGGTLNLIGNINANGTSVATSSYDAGGGAGGSVYIITNTLSGSGSVTVNGGAGGTFGQVAGAGGGGRIAIYYSTDSSSITYSASTGSTNGVTSIYGAAGTIYKEQSSGSKHVIINNNNRIPNNNYATLPASLSVDTLTLSDSGSLNSNTSITNITLNIINNGILQLSSTGTVTYTTLNWASGGTIIDRSGTFNLISNGGALTVPTGAYLYADTARSYTGVTIDGILSHSANGSTETYKIAHTITGGGTYTVNGTISIDGQGFAAGQGTGKGTNGNGAGGASYGGEGGNDAYAGNPGGIVYGSMVQPTNLGSGGGIDGIGGAGGGALKIDVTGGTIIVNGSITAGGTNPGSGNDDAGGGSGGSIYIIANDLSGSGTLSADGGSGYRFGGAGGGGRIALYFTTDSSSWTLAAKGGVMGGSGGGVGAAGTIYMESTGGTKSVIIDNAGRNPVIKCAYLPANVIVTDFTLNNYGALCSNSTATTTNLTISNSGVLWNLSGSTLNYTILNWSSGGIIYDRGGTLASISVGDLVVPSTTYLYADTTRSYSSVDVTGTVTTSNNTTLAAGEVYKLNYSVTGNLTVNSGGMITTDTSGFQSTEGTGAGVDSTGGSGGGGYGGIGGNGNVGAGGPAYGSDTNPINLGSGGGQDGVGNGGRGGGAILLSVNGTTTINGNVTSNGGNSVALDSGGGSGGTVYINTNIFNGNGTVYAKGGNGNLSTGGGGAGGRVAIYYASWGWTGNTMTPAVATAGGTAKNAGNVGTVYLGSSNSLPSVSSVSIDSGALNIDLTENTTTPVVCSAVVTDLNGYLDIYSVTAKLFRTGIGASSLDDNNNHYTLSGDTQCIPSGGSSTSENYTCTFAVYYHAEPTDIGSLHELDNWTCEITPSDGEGAGTTDVDDIEMNSMRALSVPENLSYGQLDKGNNTTGDITSLISNTGNSSIDLDLKGYNMCTDYPTCAGYTLPVTRQEYALTSFSYGTGNILTTTDTGVNISLAKPTSDPTNSTVNLFWGIGIPTNQEVGYYLGVNVFTAVSDN